MGVFLQPIVAVNHEQELQGSTASLGYPSVKDLGWLCLSADQGLVNPTGVVEKSL